MWLVLVHAAAVWFMTGVIFTGDEQAHNARFARVVGPASPSRRSPPVGLILAKPTELNWAAPATAAILLTGIVISTVSARPRACPPRPRLRPDRALPAGPQ